MSPWFTWMVCLQLFLRYAEKQICGPAPWWHLGNRLGATCSLFRQLKNQGSPLQGGWAHLLPMRAAHLDAAFLGRWLSVSSWLLIGKYHYATPEWEAGSKLGLFINVTQKSWILFQIVSFSVESRNHFNISMLQFSPERKGRQKVPTT